MRVLSLVWIGLSIFFFNISIISSDRINKNLRQLSDNSTLKPSKQLISEDYDIFIPYQGERFSVFDWSLYKLLARKYQGNILISPASLKLALVLLYEGAQDQTAHELAGVMQLPVGQWATREKFSLIIRSLQSHSDDYQLNIGTRIYMNQNVSVKQSYAAIVKTFYGTDIVSSNFTNAQSTVNNINNWVKNFTSGNIEKMIEDGNSIKDSIMLVMNVLYFKGLWYGNKFLPNKTRIDVFHQDAQNNTNVTYIKAVGDFYYAESSELDAKILRIPYIGHKFAMYLILPRTIDGLDQLIKNMNPFTLTRHVWLMQRLPVEVTIPKFKFDFTSHLESVLRELGIRDIFDNTAILTGIAKAKRNQHLYVTDVVQKAGIEVDEKGTSAYAATVTDQQFYADHPFAFYIEDEITGTILYMGRVTNPLESSGSTEQSTATPEKDESFENQNAHTFMINPSLSNVERSNFFDIELLQAASDIYTGNIVISPFSVKSALTILSEGTGGITRDELVSTLRLPTDILKIRANSKQLLLSLLSTRNGTEIHLANRLWLGRTAPFSDMYNNLLRMNYGGDTKNVVFLNTITSAAMINEWVKQNTRHHILSVVHPNSLNPNTQILLTSALYFKGNWMEAFDINLTRDRCFNIPNRGCKEVPMMESVSHYRYAEIPELKADIVEIPYSDGKYSMLILLPHREGLRSLLILSKDIAYVSISTIMNTLQDTELILQLPRFTIESKTDLRPALENMGIRDLFSYSANFTGILIDGEARVENVFHNAKIEVSETGTIAAAVTGLSVVPLIGSTLETFRADRPFLFLLVDRHSSSMLFAGRVIEP
ncbi:uncharacterized protein [Chelonus insularis]|uniref:uncharacterized protein isoform X2 n=1 Tax=Chelonus insularis TaxID=460826 RepID=UPI00158F56F9|nr:uncharacterized protein LOC118071724 isoform X2 [Chelonus insularis]